MNDPLTIGEVQIRERQTSRTARYVMLGAEPAKVRRVWIALHGYGMLASRFVRPFQGVIPSDTCVVAPEALSRFYLEMPRADGGHMQRIGAAWLTKESRETEIVDAHRWLDLVHDEVLNEVSDASGAKPLLGILAFSQGVATAMRWIASSAVRPQQFVAWAGSLAQDVDRPGLIQKLRQSELVLVTGDQDQFASEGYRRATLGAVQSLGIPYRALSFEGTHELNVPLLSTLLTDFGTPT